MLDTATKTLDALQLAELKKFGNRVTKFGVNFAVCNAEGELILQCEGAKFTSCSKSLRQAGLHALSEKVVQNNKAKKENIEQADGNSRILASVLKGGADEPSEFAVLIDLGNSSLNCSDEDMPSQSGSERHPISDVFDEMLGLLTENFAVEAKAAKQINKVGVELSHTYEELVLLHKLSTNMRVTEPDSNFLQMACDSLTDIISVEGIAILLVKIVEGGRRLVLAAGSGLIDINEHMADILHDRLVTEIGNGKEALLDSSVYAPLKYDWPENIESIIAVPLCGKDRTGAVHSEIVRDNTSIIGLMIAINITDKPDFDSTDIKLFNSVANGCAVFIENVQLFTDLKELFIGSLKALTSSIDAKDQYTRGHSERVAFISRWIAERVAESQPLAEEQIHRIYLAGLLHDLGKMGIEESVLRKEGKLTDEEFTHIRSHPSVGAGILSGIKQMRDIVPGVLSHHERADGKGYPNGLTGGQMSLMSKIISLADSFDAMTSKRVYRDAMTVEQALAEIERGLGTQFDAEIGKIFIDSDVYRLWDIIQDGFTEDYGTRDFSEYGTAAVGTLIR